MNSYQRDVLDFLHAEYGVRPSVRYGGKHPYLLVEYHGKSHRIAMSASPSDHRATANAEAQIRRLLGPPAAKPNGPRRTLEMLMDELPTPAPIEAKAVDSDFAEPPTTASEARVAIYREHASEKTRFNVFVTHALAERFGRHNGVAIEAIDAETFRIYADPATTRRFRFGSTQAAATIRSPLPEVLFGASPAEAVEVDGSILVTCPIATRVPIGPPIIKKAKPLQTGLDDGPQLPRPTPRLPPWAATPSAAVDREMLLGLLREINRVEASEWRLVRVNGAWRWRIPEVALDDD